MGKENGGAATGGFIHKTLWAPMASVPFRHFATVPSGMGLGVVVYSMGPVDRFYAGITGIFFLFFFSKCGYQSHSCDALFPCAVYTAPLSGEIFIIFWSRLAAAV